jgi:hypothetical protein
MSFGPLIGIKNFELYTSLLSSDVKYYKLKNKFEDTSFINNIKCYDIIGLVETHLVESLPAPLKNYNIHHTYRKQNVKTKRNFGGISVLIKKKPINSGENTNSNFVWLKLSSSFYNLEKDLFVCFLHIPIENSTYSQSQGDQFEQLTQDILNYSDKGDILLCGDFNGRVSTLHDFIVNDSDGAGNNWNYDNKYNVDSCRFRDNQDKIVTTRGKHILDLCVQSRLRIEELLVIWKANILFITP